MGRITKIAKELEREGAQKAPFPQQVKPQLALLVKEPPKGENWVQEIKFDGYRMLCFINGGKTRFVSRNQLDWSHRFPQMVTAALELEIEQVILDGEIVALNPDGTTSFQRLQNAMKQGERVHLAYFVFDLLYLAGYDLRPMPLLRRKEALAKLLGGSGELIRYNDHYQGNSAKFLEQACKHGLEGIISKRLDRPYQAGRSGEWQKIKCVHKQKFVIGGYTEPGGARIGFGALLVGYYNPKGELIYAGKVGTGYRQKTLTELLGKMKKLAQRDCPFKVWSAGIRSAHWIKPALVGEVAFTEWTDEGVLRHPSFQGLREDKKARDVMKELEM